MTELAELRRLLVEVERARCCSQPVRIRGLVLRRNSLSPEVLSVSVACKDRRESVCLACSRLYRADAWHLIAAGLVGGKGVRESVREHPRLFVTLTAPSFGAVHSDDGEGTRPCHPRRNAAPCEHGKRASCMRRHAPEDPVLGNPLCPGCFDYEGAVLWNSRASELWSRTTTKVRRALANRLGESEASLGARARVSFVKVAEFQRRGLVHFHAVVRVDGAEGPSGSPPVGIDAELLSAALVEAARGTTVARPDGVGRFGWGQQLDARDLDSTDEAPEAIASYTASYAVKTSDSSDVLARRLRSVRRLEELGVRPHLAEMVRTAWDLGGTPSLRQLRLRAHAHTLGYRGFFLTKSRRYSTTFGALREARMEYANSRDEGGDPQAGMWQYEGHGYLDERAAALAEALMEARTRLPRAFSERSPSAPQGAEQG